MSIVVPAILPQSRKDLEEKIARLAGIPAIDAVQVDAVDGRFATPACWPYTIPGALMALVQSGALLPSAGRFVYDADLMVDSPEHAVSAWSALGASRLTVHAESTPSLAHTLAAIRAKHGHEAGFAPGLFALGLAISIETDLALIAPHLANVDYVQLMGIATIGKQRQPFDRRVLAKIHAVRQLSADITIQVDGGVSLATAPELLAAGADRLIVGHALWEAHDIAAEVAKFDALSARIRSKVL
jgi:ribulose-phosphate 3-epimerase